MELKNGKFKMAEILSFFSKQIFYFLYILRNML
jgi:hypothetical protein